MTPLRLVTMLALGLCASAQTLAQTNPALDTKSGTVSAQVLDTCKFKNPASTIALRLGDLNPSAGNAKAITEVYNFFCTKGFTVQIGVAGQTVPLTTGTGQARQLAHKTQQNETLAYTLTASLPDGNTGKGFGPGNDLALQLTATAAGADYLNAKGGEYEDTLVVELRP